MRMWVFICPGQLDGGQCGWVCIEDTGRKKVSDFRLCILWCFWQSLSLDKREVALKKTWLIVLQAFQIEAAETKGLRGGNKNRSIKVPEGSWWDRSRQWMNEASGSTLANTEMGQRSVWQRAEVNLSREKCLGRLPCVWLVAWLLPSTLVICNWLRSA